MPTGYAVMERAPALSADPFGGLLDPHQAARLREALAGRLVALCFGAGVDSTAMLVALRAAGLRPDLITFADTGAEKSATLRHIERLAPILAAWGWPPITTVRKAMLPTTPYNDLYGNCWENETLPSLAFGRKSCSAKWKGAVQDQYVKGVTRGPNKQPPHALWLEAKRRGARIVKLLGYDCGRADKRRSGAIDAHAGEFDFCYPLQLIGWVRSDCVQAIVQTLGAALVPVKSACFMCPASKQWELFWLAAHEPDMLERALQLEYRALTGRHSRFDAIEFGSTWEDLVRTADRFPSTATCVGLGRSFSWCQWARSNNVTGDGLAVRRTLADRRRFIAAADAGRGDDNALDARALKG